MAHAESSGDSKRHLIRYPRSRGRDVLQVLDLNKLRIPNRAFGDHEANVTYTASPADGHLHHARLTQMKKEYVQHWMWCLKFLQKKDEFTGSDRVSSLFELVMKESLDMPVEGVLAGQLWNIFIRWGVDDDRRFEPTIQYVEALQRRTRKTRQRLYKHIMVHMLKNNAGMALKRHERLKAAFPPDVEAYKRLFFEAERGGASALKSFEAIYQDHPVHGIYDDVLAYFYAKDSFVEAAHWKKILLQAGDGPADPLSTRRLILEHAMAIDRNQREFYGMQETEPEAEVKPKTPMDAGFRQEAVAARNTLGRHFARFSLATGGLSDRFCARLFATAAFSVDMIIQGLEAFGAKTLGPASIREIVARDGCRSSLIRIHLDKIETAGITFDPSRYTSLIRGAVSGGNDILLESILTSDFHSDVFGDLPAQEHLLMRYIRRDDLPQIARSREVLLFDVPKDEVVSRWSNILLRCFVALGDRQKALVSLNLLQQKNLKLERATQWLIRHHYLKPRLGRFIPGTVRTDLYILTSAMKYEMSMENRTPPGAWRELLKRFGMFGHLVQYESLALWLVEVYPPHQRVVPRWGTGGRFGGQKGGNLAIPGSLPAPARRPVFPATFPRDGLSNPRPSSRFLDEVTGQRPEVTSIAFARVRSSTSPESAPSDHPLRPLFNKVAVQAIIAWGFKSELGAVPNRQLASRRGLMRSIPSWLWGVRLVKTLQERGVPIEKAWVARACKLRMLQLFNWRVRSRRVANRKAFSLNRWRAAHMSRYTLRSYVREIMKIWGHDLFDVFRRNRRSALRWKDLRRRRGKRARGSVYRRIDYPSQNNLDQRRLITHRKLEALGIRSPVAVNMRLSGP